MKPLLIAALALICPFGTSVKATQVPPSGAVIPFWSPVGSWVVLLLRLEKGGYTCAALTRSPPAGPAGYSMGFALSASTTHCYLNYSPPPRSACRPRAWRPSDLFPTGHSHPQLIAPLHILTPQSGRP